MSMYYVPGVLWGTADTLENGQQTIKAFSKTISDIVMKEIKHSNIIKYMG